MLEREVNYAVTVLVTVADDGETPESELRDVAAMEAAHGNGTVLEVAPLEVVARG